MSAPSVAAPSFAATVAAVARGTKPLLFKARGWVLGALVLGPVLGALGVMAIIALKSEGPNPFGVRIGLTVYHSVLVSFMVPIMALVGAGAGIREDLEQRTLPLMLVRPALIPALPFGKGLPWFLWGAMWLTLGALLLQTTGGGWESLPGRITALVALWWAELAFVTAFSLVFKRGLLWSALWFFVWERFLVIFPPTLQRLTFSHHAQSLAGSRFNESKAPDFLAQAPVDTPFLLSLLALAAAGAAFWAWAGWKLHRTPTGLAGAETEG